jgi:hypothetical protein
MELSVLGSNDGIDVFVTLYDEIAVRQKVQPTVDRVDYLVPVPSQAGDCDSLRIPDVMTHSSSLPRDCLVEMEGRVWELDPLVPRENLDDRATKICLLPRERSL